MGVDVADRSSSSALSYSSSRSSMQPRPHIRLGSRKTLTFSTRLEVVDDGTCFNYLPRFMTSLGLCSSFTLKLCTDGEHGLSLLMAYLIYIWWILSPCKLWICYLKFKLFSAVIWSLWPWRKSWLKLLSHDMFDLFLEPARFISIYFWRAYSYWSLSTQGTYGSGDGSAIETLGLFFIVD